MTATIKATSTSATPILDQQAPLPPPAPPGSGARLMIGLGIGLTIALAAIFSAWGPTFLEFAEQRLPAILTELFPDHWTGVRIATLSLMAILVAYSAVAVHEIGHVLGGLCAGFRFKALRIGPLRIQRGFRISFIWQTGAWLGGGADMVPIGDGNLAPRALALACAGPAASLLSGLAVLLLCSGGLAAWSYALASLAGGLSDLVPFRTRMATSDGARLCKTTGSYAKRREGVDRTNRMNRIFRSVV